MTRLRLLPLILAIALPFAAITSLLTPAGHWPTLVGAALAKDGSDDSGGSGDSSGSGGSGDDSGSGSGSGGSGGGSDSSGSGDDDSGSSGPGSGSDEGDGSGRGGGGSGRDGDAGLNDLDPRSGEPAGRREDPSGTIEVIATSQGIRLLHPDGWREELIRGIYRMRDPRGRLVISRPADHSDYRRFRRP